MHEDDVVNAVVVVAGIDWQIMFKNNLKLHG